MFLHVSSVKTFVLFIPLIAAIFGCFFSILGNIRDLQHVISYYFYESVLDFLHESVLRLRVMNETYTA